MSRDTTTEAISRSAARLRWVVLGAMAIMALLYGAALFGLDFGQVRIEHRQAGPSAGLIGAINLALLLLALFRLTQMLGRIAAGELFTVGVIGRFRGFAFWLLAMAVFGMLAPTVAQLLQIRPGGHHLEVRIDFRDVLTVGVTLVLFLLARLLERARRIDEENREFV